jgi:hypothetical protein
MHKKPKGMWRSKRGPTPALLPPYRAPRQRQSERVLQFDESSDIIDMSESRKESESSDIVDTSEARKEDESEDETQFGVVWESYVPQDKQVIECETNLFETQTNVFETQFGNVLTYSPDRQAKKPKKKKRPNFVYLIEETEEQKQDNLLLVETAET